MIWRLEGSILEPQCGEPGNWSGLSLRPKLHNWNNSLLHRRKHRGKYDGGVLGHTPDHGTQLLLMTRGTQFIIDTKTEERAGKVRNLIQHLFEIWNIDGSYWTGWLLTTGTIKRMWYGWWLSLSINNGREMIKWKEALQTCDDFSKHPEQLLVLIPGNGDCSSWAASRQALDIILTYW